MSRLAAPLVVVLAVLAYVLPSNAWRAINVLIRGLV